MNETTRTEGKRPQKDDGTSTDTEPTPRDAWFDLHHFQRDILAAIAAHDGVPHGLAIKDQLEAWYDEEVNHGRLYPNLDELVEGDLLAKSEKDKRTNGYALTDQGNDALTAGADHLDAVRPAPRHEDFDPKNVLSASGDD